VVVVVVAAAAAAVAVVPCSAQSRAFTERLNPPLFEEETPFLKHIHV
jgi:hypothetical protein